MLWNSVVATLAAAVAAAFLEQAWWIRGIVGALFGVVAFVGLPAAYQWAQKRSDVITLHFECAVDFLPTKLPPEGRVTVVQLSPSGVPNQGGTSMLKYGEPGAPTSWPPHTHAYKCVVRNLSDKDAIDAALTFTAVFREVLHGDAKPVVMSAGTVAKTGKVSIVLPRLAPRETNPFTFFVTNLAENYVTVEAPVASYFHQRDDQPRLSVRSGLLSPMEFSPPT
jgi:hypothetical protein